LFLVTAVSQRTFPLCTAPSPWVQLANSPSRETTFRETTFTTGDNVFEHLFIFSSEKLNPFFSFGDGDLHGKTSESLGNIGKFTV